MWKNIRLILVTLISLAIIGYFAWFMLQKVKEEPEFPPLPTNAVSTDIMATKKPVNITEAPTIEPEVTEQPELTEAPKPTAVPPTEAPAPTKKPEPTKSAVPTVTLEVTEAPTPTVVPTATSMPLPPTKTPTATPMPLPPTKAPTATPMPLPPTVAPTATPTPATVNRITIVPGPDDHNVIPDKHNTGASGTLAKVELGAKLGEVQLGVDGTGSNHIFDFANKNQTVSGTIEFRNLDFSDHTIQFYRENLVERDIKLVFINCKFARMLKGGGKSRVTAEFRNCTFVNFAGANATFDGCFFGKSYLDGMNPFSNVTVKNCYFADVNGTYGGPGKHSDGMQIYGDSGNIAENISFFNCRFEVPAFSTGDNTAGVNACIMLQLEYSSGHNIFFDKCIVNGGAYTIYARSVKEEYTIEEVYFDDIRVGCSKLVGTLRPDNSLNVKMTNLRETDSLYVASVWKASGTTYLSVTNDTDCKRKLTVYTDRGVYEFEVAACPDGSRIGAVSGFDKLPFDVTYSIPADCAYVVCFDTTSAINQKQIRFVNWSNVQVAIAMEERTGELTEIPVITSGSCGKNITYTLTEDGVLTLTGTGATYDYHSAKPVPWADYISKIKTVRVETGIEYIGTQIFQGCVALGTVELSEGIKTISSRAFSRCTSLLSIQLPKSLESLGETAFMSAAAFKIYCTREQYEDWKNYEQIGPRLVVK